MKQRMRCFLIAVQIITWVHVSTRFLASHHVAPQQVPELLGDGFNSKQVVESSGGGGYLGEKTNRRIMGRIGSMPPNCQRKCGGCTPCIATQIPATSKELRTQYTNYEPEGWKCKCHSTFFNP
ncbi:hypothetical protein V6Z11_D06G084200 [Gossypium hirsutum]|uniref:Epidermal patterning factor-like protein n=4 Tax=Gossypium TaxID=3633 RepID=A0ABM3A8T7_GOSHI|nr:EPIDERMAL PATTERNING FACTOR-like protein 5 [Gossypium hirsutum]TYG64214.1 hypothetical protein ES288_D06G090300v1 [Gossypium darwinii]TYH65983.1 hypothetical protein ES332_D06G092500v1 [Gossypium tomentosum]